MHRRPATGASRAAATSGPSRRPRTARRCVTTTQFAYVAAWECGAGEDEPSRSCTRRTSSTRHRDEAAELQVRSHPEDLAPGRRRRPRVRMHTYEVDDVSEDMSFLEMLDVLNEELNAKGEEPIAFDSDCREGICGIVRADDQRRGPRPRGHHDLPAAHALASTTATTITIEPWRADAFPVHQGPRRRPRRLRPDHPGGRLHLGQHRLGARRARHAGAQATNADRAFNVADLHRLRRLRRGLPERLGVALHGRQDHPPRRAAAGPARAGQPGSSTWSPSTTTRASVAAPTSASARGLPQGHPARRDLPAQQGPARRPARLTRLVLPAACWSLRWRTPNLGVRHRRFGCVGLVRARRRAVRAARTRRTRRRRGSCAR